MSWERGVKAEELRATAPNSAPPRHATHDRPEWRQQFPRRQPFGVQGVAYFGIMCLFWTRSSGLKNSVVENWLVCTVWPSRNS